MNAKTWKFENLKMWKYPVSKSNIQLGIGCWILGVCTFAHFAAFAAPAAPVLDGKGIRIEFDSAERGFGCLAIKNKLGEKEVQFGSGASDGQRLGFWAMKFWKDGKSSPNRWLTNQSPSSRSFDITNGVARFYWKGLSLAEEKGVVDVTATVALSEDGESAQWRISVANRSKSWGLAELEYPVISRVVVTNTATALLPCGNMGGELVENYAQGGRHEYPHGTVPVQTFSFMMDGVGLQFTALDGKGQNKAFDTRGLDMKVWYKCPDEGQPGAANAPDYAVETAAFKGDWWVAAKRYRKWALKQPWASKGPLKDRRDFCKKIGEVGYWMLCYGPNVRGYVSAMKHMLPDVPLGVHWYCWHNSPFDVNYPEMFPVKPNIRDAAAWMKKNNVFCMPYINGSLWEDEIPSFTNARPSACKWPNGSLIMYKCGNGNSLVRMCPTTDLWRKTVAEMTAQLYDELNVDGVYLDQVSCSLPQPCHDASHGHKLGGGDFWTQGYRELMKPICEDSAKRGRALTSESAAEPYMDSFDAFLTWWGNNPRQVPFLPAVYSGYALYFGCSQAKNDSLDAYCALNGRFFLWGVQLGWTTLLFEKGKEKEVEFTHKLCRARMENLDCFLYGELVGELIPVGEVPTVDVKWNRDKVEFKTPAIMSAVWLSDKGKRCAFIVNISDKDEEFSFKVTPNGKTHTLTIPARSVRVCR